MTKSLNLSTEKICTVCKSKFISTGYNRKRRKCCSDKCAKSAKKKGKYIKCKTCHKTFYISEYWAKKDKQYCSQKCYFQSRWGKDGRKEIRKCKTCDKTFECFVSDEKVCCSKECSMIHRAKFNEGEKSRFWRGGKVAPYHKGWKRYREQALKRDNYKCTICDSNDRLQVHHIIPYRYSQNHNLDNLTTLCRSCHSKEEYKVNIEFRNGLREKRWST